ncbi:uncharacterized protein V6R79_017255 [Siganus canaliculatus]
MKRSYESGSQKKKEKKLDFISKLPKVSTFFTLSGENKEEPIDIVSDDGAGSSANAPSAGSDSASDAIATTAAAYTESDCDRETVVLEYDPALWSKQLTDRERCSIVQEGPVQVKDQSFPQNTKGRRFTKDYLLYGPEKW